MGEYQGEYRENNYEKKLSVAGAKILGLTNM